MKTILALGLNDLKRDWKQPWSIILLAAIPLLLSSLIASVFGGRGGSGPRPTVHVAVLDQDQDMISGMLRSLPSQGDAAQQLRLHFVENRDDGLRLVEKGQASALVVLPKNMTENLLDGQTNSIELYENPAEQIMPKIVRQGVSLLALGLSGAADVLSEPLKDARTLTRGSGFPTDAAVTALAGQSTQRLRSLRTYLFPPLIQFQTIAAADYSIGSTNTVSSAESP